jgi:hypothetical protein
MRNAGHDFDGAALRLNGKPLPGEVCWMTPRERPKRSVNSHSSGRWDGFTMMSMGR